MSHSPPTREKRWIILADDGRHVTIGRHTDPSIEEIDLAAENLKHNGVGGWLAVTEGRYYSRGQLSLMMVREIAAPRSAWDEAVATFMKIRSQATSTPSSPPRAG
jgi:hypothetical protein